MIVPITIQGTDTFGQTFKENTWTIGINKQGARIATFHTLTSGSQIWIVNPVLGRTAKGRVIWLGEKRFPEDPYEVGVELTEDQNVWGINFPPEDWEKQAMTGSPLPPQEKSAGAGALPGSPIPAPQGRVPESKPLQAANAAGEKTGEPAGEKLSQFNLAVAALSHFAQQEVNTEPTASIGSPGRPQESLLAPSKVDASSPVGPSDPQGQSLLHEVARRVDEKEKSLRSLELELTNLLERLRSSQDQIETLLARAKELPRTPEVKPETRQHNLQKDWPEQTREPLEDSIRGFCEALQKQLEDVCRTTLDKTRGESERLLDELHTRLDHAARALRPRS